MGFSLPIATVASTGLSSLKISLPTITVAFLAADHLWESLPSEISSTDLNWFGTAICGGSAIAAAAPIIEADEEEIALIYVNDFLLQHFGCLYLSSIGAFMAYV